MTLGHIKASSPAACRSPVASSSPRSLHPPPTRLRTPARLARAWLGLWLALWVTAAPAGQLDVIVMLDNSGSMRKSDPQFLTAVSVRRFLAKLEAGARVGILAFDQDVRWAMEMTEVSEATRPQLLAALDSIDYQGSLTDSPRALERAIYELKVNGRPGAARSIVFMTDGIVDTGDEARDLDRARWMQVDLAAEAADEGIRIFGVAFTENADFQLIQALARRTDGGYFRAFEADDIEGVFDRIVGELAEMAQPAAPALTAQSTPAIAPPAAPRTAFPVPVEPTTVEPTTTGPAPAEPLAVTVPVVPPAMPPGPPEPPASASADDDAPRGPVGAPAEPAAGPGAGDDSPAVPESTARIASPLVLGAVAVLAVAGIAGALVLRRRPRRDARAVPTAFLNDLDGVTDKPSYELTLPLTVIGRLPGGEPESANFVVIDEATVGRRHALIEYKDHAFWVIDQSSLNGTYVNGQRVEGEVRLRHGDRIRFHSHEFEFLLLEMFETDHTMVSDTRFAALSADIVEEHLAHAPGAERGRRLRRG